MATWRSQRPGRVAAFQLIAGKPPSSGQAREHLPAAPHRPTGARTCRPCERVSVLDPAPTRAGSRSRHWTRTCALSLGASASAMTRFLETSRHRWPRAPHRTAPAATGHPCLHLPHLCPRPERKSVPRARRLGVVAQVVASSRRRRLSGALAWAVGAVEPAAGPPRPNTFDLRPYDRWWVRAQFGAEEHRPRQREMSAGCRPRRGPRAAAGRLRAVCVAGVPAGSSPIAS